VHQIHTQYQVHQIQIQHLSRPCKPRWWDPSDTNSILHPQQHQQRLPQRQQGRQQHWNQHSNQLLLLLLLLVVVVVVVLLLLVLVVVVVVLLLLLGRGLSPARKMSR
jgi:Flp pilus assembly protein TadB